MDLECTAGIAKIAIKAVEEDGIVTRVVRMTLTREFDHTIAAAIGGNAYEFRDSLAEHDAVKIEIPIDAMKGECRLQGEQGDEVIIKLVEGIKATGKAPGKDDDGPTIELVYDFPFQRNAWDFFGRNVGARATLTFTKTQLELPGTNGANGAHANGTNGTASADAKAKLQAAADRLAKSTGGGVAITVQGQAGEVLAHVETEEQAAETPAEAEAVRAERLERERADAVPAPSAFVLARYEAISPEIVIVAPEGVGTFLARYETPVSVIEALGFTEEAAREGLRDKLFAKFADDEAKLAGAGAPPKATLKAPPRNGKAKKAAAAPTEDNACDGPGCEKAHVHDAPPETGETPPSDDDDGLAF